MRELADHMEAAILSGYFYGPRLAEFREAKRRADRLLADVEAEFNDEERFPPPIVVGR